MAVILFDVVDCNGQSGANDSSCRPNQMFAISLEHPVLDQTRWSSVVNVAQEKLLLRSGYVPFRLIIPITNQFTRATFVRATVLTIKGQSGPG